MSLHGSLDDDRVSWNGTYATRTYRAAYDLGKAAAIHRDWQTSMHTGMAGIKLKPMPWRIAGKCPEAAG
jgi:hypothetical protein